MPTTHNPTKIAALNDAQLRTPRPHPLFVMALVALGCVAEKVARKADRVTPASCNKVALMTEGSNSDEVIVIPRPQ